MDKQKKRLEAKKASIQQSARELFALYGVDKVSMDEIAAKANVSKMTVYKYFGSKDELYAEVINTFLDEILDGTEKVLTSDLDFLDKLKLILFSQANVLPMVSANYLFQILEKDKEANKSIPKSFPKRVEELMYKFFEEGKSKGFIAESLSFELLYLYAEIFQAGVKAKTNDVESPPLDKDTFEKLTNLYFFGIINRDHKTGHKTGE